MVFNTFSVATAVTPSVIETYVSHYLHRAPLRQKPTAHISYHEGLRLIREFLEYSSKHSVEELQAFTAQHVPSPTWVRLNDAEIAPQFLERAANLLHAQLGHRGRSLIGGGTWWQWRRPDRPLRAEWIEMKKEYHERKRTGGKCERAILYLHGGAYYFGSVDEHRYQMQRHARKLRARVLAPRYRLAPQFPFPCALYDCLATYFYLLEHFAPSQILFAGDSAGAGLVLSMLVVLRDQEVALPAGTILLSPWVDLTHSFPSVAGDGAGDYIPSHGFHHKPSMAWPPPTGQDGRSEGEGMAEDAVELPATAGVDMPQRVNEDGEGGEAAPTNPNPPPTTSSPPVPRFGSPLTITLNNQPTPLPDQIHLYTTNPLLSHPLVSPILQPSLGGLPPMLIQTGGAELLRDEQLYLAHKAANPTQYPPNETIMREFDPSRKTLERWPPTDVQVQLWDDLCHVPHTLSFTRPAKYMYRGVAQFGAWAFARAQGVGLGQEGANDDAASVISSGVEDGEDEKSLGESSAYSALEAAKSSTGAGAGAATVGKAGDPLPPFKDHMIRQRVTRHGVIYPLAPASELACLALDPAAIGVPNPNSGRKWSETRHTQDRRLASGRKRIEKKRAKEAALGYDGSFAGENPPPTALVNRRRKGVAPEEKKKGRSWGLAMWSGWGSSHDEQTLQREMKTERETGARKGSAVSASTGERKVIAGGGFLTVPEGGRGGREKRMRRTSSVSARLQRPWASSSSSPSPATRERQDGVPAAGLRAPYEEVVVDDGQDGERSQDATARSETAFLHTNGQNAVPRPTSASVNSPIPVENETRHRRQESRNAQDAPIAVVSTTPVVSTSVEKMPKPEDAHISPGQSELQNGIQGNAFRLAAVAASDPPAAPLDNTENMLHNGVQGNAFRMAAIAAGDPPAVSLDNQTPPVPSITGTNGLHSELAGDAPAPVELPSTNERELDGNNQNGQVREYGIALSAGTDSSPEPRGMGAVEPPMADDMDELVSPIAPGNDLMMGEGLVSPVEQPAQQKWPFKLRNQVFDQRTSMLGSIGADGMPNAHHSFTRDDSPRRKAPSSGETTPDAAKSNQNQPLFKMRHTGYEPEGTYVSKASSSLQVPEPEASDGSSSSPHRESGALGMQLGGQRIVGDQRDQPPLYENGPPTNVIMPEPVARVPVVRPSTPGGVENDKPPPPPPKDDRPVKPKAKTTGLRKPIQTIDAIGSIGTNMAASKSSGSPATSVAPVIGDLSFERPQLERFFTASEGRDLQLT